MAEIVLDAKAETLFDTLSDLKAEALMDRLADNIAEAEAEILGDTSRYVEAEKELDTLHSNLVEEVQTPCNRLRDVQFETMSMLQLRW